MTDEYPKILWVCPKKQGYNAHEQQYKLPDDVKYIHHTTHEAALQALEVARDVLSYYNEYDQNNGYRARQALKQINAILGCGE